MNDKAMSVLINPLPCPFCDSAPSVRADDGEGGCSIVCYTCPAEPFIRGLLGELDETIVEWNRRGPPRKGAALSQREAEILLDVLQIVRYAETSSVTNLAGAREALALIKQIAVSVVDRQHKGRKP